MEHLLVTLGNDLYRADSGYAVPLGDDPEAESLVRDIYNYPHAFVLACLMDRQINADRAWRIPNEIRKAIGSFYFSDLIQYGQAEYEALFTNLRLHRFNRTMATVFYKALQELRDKYDGDASRIWSNKPSSYTIVSRFLEFRGCGPKIATMAANILVRDFKVPVSDYSAIDVSADVHVVRVFTRLKLVPQIKDEGKLRDMVIQKAREINPSFPGVVDLPCWMIGREWCRPTHPLCNKCSVSSICDKEIL